LKDCDFIGPYLRPCKFQDGGVVEDNDVSVDVCVP